MVDVCSNPALMFNFLLSIRGVAYIDLTQDEDTVKMPPFKGNIAPAQKIDIVHSDIIPDNTSSIREEPWTGVAPSTLALQSVPLDVEKPSFTPSCLDKVKKLVSQENTHSALLLIQKDEVASRIEETTAQVYDVETDREMCSNHCIQVTV